MNSNITRGGQTYVSPTIAEIKVNGEQVLCTSFKTENENYKFIFGENENEGGMAW